MDEQVRNPWLTAVWMYTDQELWNAISANAAGGRSSGLRAPNEYCVRKRIAWDFSRSGRMTGKIPAESRGRGERQPGRQSLAPVLPSAEARTYGDARETRRSNPSGLRQEWSGPAGCTEGPRCRFWRAQRGTHQEATDGASGLGHLHPQTGRENRQERRDAFQVLVCDQSRRKEEGETQVQKEREKNGTYGVKPRRRTLSRWNARGQQAQPEQLVCKG